MSKTTIEFLNAIKKKYDITSNYGLARKLDQTDTDIARWMKGKNTLGDEAALKVAELLDLDPAYVLACAHAERAKNDPEKAVWQRMADMVTEHRALAASIVMVLAVLPFADTLSPMSDASSFPAMLGLGIGGNSVYYVKCFLSLSLVAFAAFILYHPAPKKEQLSHLPN